MTADPDLEVLVTFLQRVPGIVGTIGNGRLDDGLWWVKFGIDIDHPLAWNVVQEYGGGAMVHVRPWLYRRAFEKSRPSQRTLSRVRTPHHGATAKRAIFIGRGAPHAADCPHGFSMMQRRLLRKMPGKTARSTASPHQT